MSNSPLREYMRELISLHNDKATYEEIDSRIHENGQLKGTNMCILLVAILIASIGLNTNSAAVIIGAMLISPLMGPIMSIGYGMATYDTAYVKKSLFKLAIQIILSVGASAIYFSLSPMTDVTSELVKRTEPTTWDVLIAIFGGLAGIIGMTRKEKSNVIPGVAIATALMPPLCTAGYGIAVHSWSYFLGAFYLFSINSFFICASTFMVLKIIHVPAKVYAQTAIFRRQRMYLAILGFIVIAPSIYLTYGMLQDGLRQQEAYRYVESSFNTADHGVVSWKLDTSQKKLSIMLIGEPLEDSMIAGLKEEMRRYSMLQDYTLNVVQSSAQGMDAAELRNAIELEMSKSNTEIASTDAQKQASLAATYYPMYALYNEGRAFSEESEKEIKVLYPKVQSFTASPLTAEKDGKITRTGYVAIITVTEALTWEEAQAIQKWLSAKADVPVRIEVVMTGGEDYGIGGNGVW